MSKAAGEVNLSGSKPTKKVTVQLSEEPRRRAGLNLPYGIVGALPRAELLPKKRLFKKGGANGH